MYKRVKVLVEEEVLCCDGCGTEITGVRDGSPLVFPSVPWSYGGLSKFDLCPKCFDMALESVRDLLDQIKNESTTQSKSDPTRT